MKLEKLFGPACKFSQPSVYFFPFFLVLTVRSHFIYMQYYDHGRQTVTTFFHSSPFFFNDLLRLLLCSELAHALDMIAQILQKK